VAFLLGVLVLDFEGSAYTLSTRQLGSALRRGSMVMRFEAVPLYLALGIEINSFVLDERSCPVIISRRSVWTIGSIGAIATRLATLLTENLRSVSEFSA
jgi:hypothetical protein